MAFKGSKRDRMAIHNGDAKISFLRRELDMALARSDSLERENEELKHEVSRLRSQVSALKAHDNERKAMLWKKFQNSVDGAEPIPQVETIVKSPDVKKPAEEFQKREVEKEKSIQVPKLQPPKPNNSTHLQKVHGFRVPPVTAPPPPPPLPLNLLSRPKAVRRVPELVEFYRLLMKREEQKNKSSTIGTHPVIYPKNMIGEIENRSTHVLAVKSDVETQGEFINSLARAVETAAFEDISEVEAFIKWLDGELSKLVDERAVLKHFPQWPERKADALREAAFSYRDLKTLESEVLLFKDDPKQLFTQSLRRAQTCLDRLEQSVNNIERVREGTIKKYMGFHIPSQWMQDNGAIGQMKLSSLTLAKACMKRVTKELEYNEFSQEDVLIQGVRFAFRVHQFAGGFDAETKQAFEEIRKVGSGHKQ